MNLKHVPAQARFTSLLRRALLCCAACSLFNGPIYGQSSQRFPVSAKQILSTMQSLGWPLDGVQLNLPVAITATVEDPKFKIEGISVRTPHEAFVRVACRTQGECLPFFVSAVWPSSTLALGQLEQQHLEGLGPAAATSGAKRFTLRATSAVIGSNNTLPTQPMVRVGSPATLLLDGGRIHIHLQVLCGQSGNPGDRIRVTTTDRKQVYVAEIVAPGVVKGEL